MKKLTHVLLALVLVLSFASTVPAQEPVKEEPVQEPKPESLPAPDESPSLQAVPPNDLFAGAITVGVPSTTAGTTIDATVDGASECGTTNTAPGVWYHVVGNGQVLGASTCNAADFDTKISVYTDNGVTCVVGADDTTGCSNFTTRVNWLSTAGVDYYILVHGYQSAIGNFALATYTSSPGADACVNAELVGTMPYVGRAVTTAATTAPDDPLMTCSFGGAQPNSNTVWYRYTPGVDGLLTATTDTSNYDTVLGVYTGACGSLVGVACDDDSGEGTRSTISNLPVTAGTTYYIEVADWGTPGGGELTLSLSGPPPGAPAHVSAITGQPVLTRQGIELRSYVYVQNSSGAPLPGVLVTAELTVPGKGVVARSATTDATYGRAYFSDVTRTRGTWRLQVTGLSGPNLIYNPASDVGNPKIWNY